MAGAFRVALLVVALCALSASGADKAKAPPGQAKAKGKGDVKRGEYMVKTGGCNDCHTPWAFNKELNMPVPDMTKMLSGHPQNGPDPEGTVGAHDVGLIGPTFTSFKMPFGTVYAMNLTPDKETGLGSWTEEMFVKAIRTGKHMGGGGRAILPPMPWMDVNQMTDEDLKAVFAYLQSIPAIKNTVPQPKVSAEAMQGITNGFDKLQQQMKTGKGGSGR